MENKSTIRNIFLNPWLAAICFLILSSPICEEYKKDNELDVIIIGAGYSGIGAADVLFKNDIKDFIVLEAKDYIGGRVKKVNFAGVNVPLGAGWLHGVKKPTLLRDLLHKNGIKYFLDDYNNCTYRDGETGEINNNLWSMTVKEFQDILKLDQNKTNIRKNGYTLADVLKQNGWYADNKIKLSVEYFLIDFETANSADKLSGENKDYTGKNQDALITDDRGYEHVAEIISKPFKEKIKLNSEVKSIEKHGEDYFVTTNSNEVYKSKYVLVSVLKTVLEEKVIKFTPDLPDWKYDAFQYVVSGYYCKVYLKFPEKFWDDTNYIILGQTNKRFVHWQNFARIFPNYPVLMATMTGDECKASQLETDHSIVTQAYKVLSRVYGNNIPWPTDILRSNWTYDPQIRGSYINPITETTDEHFHALQARLNEQTLWFTGAYTSLETYSCVDGALRRGTEVGHELARHIISNKDARVTL